MADVATILTVWKRNNLEEQLKRIKSQTVACDIIVWQNENHFEISPELKQKHPFTHVHAKDKNYKFHGRFALPLILKQKYICVFDDDTMPNPKWIEKCIRSCEEKNAIIGANGRLIRKNLSQKNVDFPKQDAKVDFVGHAWFFKQQWIHHMWRTPNLTFDNGEDIHICAACKIYGNIDSYVAGQAVVEEKGDVAQDRLGSDQHATYLKGGHVGIRKKVIQYWLNKGWKPMGF